ncbi:hypothetical protein C9439_06165 [archaeon SCG-AAA382B04]|nr:hypothetical protein C9439_06165 [archaeon SCG-AAA382B04]
MPDENIKKLLSKMQYMYYQTELDGSEVDFREFISGLKEGGSFRGIIHTQKFIKVEKGPKEEELEDSYVLLDKGKIKLAILVNKGIRTGKNALKNIKNPDEIKYTRLNDEKLREIIKKAKEADVLIE